MKRVEHYTNAEHLAAQVLQQLEKLGNDLPEELDEYEMRTYLARLQGISTLIQLGQLYASLANCRVKEVDLAESQDQVSTAPATHQDQDEKLGA